MVKLTKLDVINEEDMEIAQEISMIIKRLGISPNKNGYHYLRKAILECYKDPSLIHKITKGIYPMLAETFQKKTTCVERSIRSAIETGWIRGDYEYSNKLFLSCIGYEKSRPTNGEFISVITDHLLLKHNKNNM